MKRLFVVLIMILALLAFPGSASAQPLLAIEGANVAEWLTSDPIDWASGGTFAGLGLVGALITIFGLVGGAVPGTAGQAGIDAGIQRLETLSRRLDGLIDANPPNADQIQAIEATVNNLRTYLTREKWRQFLIASLLYAVLGAAVASLLAQDILQAIVIGAGWTAFLGSFGLQREYRERHSERDAEIDAAVRRMEKVEESIQEGTRRVDLEAAMRSLEVAKRI